MIEFWLSAFGAVGDFLVFLVWLFVSFFLLLDMYEKFQWSMWVSFWVGLVSFVVLNSWYWGNELAALVG